MSSLKAAVWGRSEAWTASVALSVLENARAFPARPSLAPDRGDWSHSVDSFVVSNQIVCLDLMNVWKEPLVCMGQQKRV